MAGLIPRAVAALYVKDTDTSRVRDNIITALNPVLTFLTNNFAQDNPILTFLRNVKGLSAVFTGNVRSASLDTGPLSAAASRFSGDMVVNGNAYYRTRTVNGFFVQPSAVGPAFTTSNVNGAPRFVVTDTGAVTASDVVTAPSFVSAAGFLDTVPVGTYWSSTFTANNLVPLNQVVNNNGGLGGIGTTPYMRRMPRAGSIVGYTLNQAAPPAGNNMLFFYRNGTFIFSWNAGVGGNNTTFTGTQPKGMYPFNAGDLFNVSYSNSSAGNTQVLAHVTFEMSA